MQAACHGLGGTVIADTNRDHGGSSWQTERRKSFGLLIFYTQAGKMNYRSSPTIDSITISSFRAS